MGDEMNYQTPRPEGKVWEKATLYKIYVMEQRLPICGYRSVWVSKVGNGFVVASLFLGKSFV